MTGTACPVVLIVRDGWGFNPHPEHDAFNAVKLARTPACERLLSRFPWTLIRTSGEDVGLNKGMMGNSEVGHQNLGAGRIVDQESMRITRAIRDSSFFENELLVRAVQSAKQADRTVHVMGIASDAGVHGLLLHLYACLELCQRQECHRVALHLFTDGRDSGPFTGKGYIRGIENHCRRLGVGRIASICGRYFAMDRDYRWERVQRAYQLLTGEVGDFSFDTAEAALQSYYDHPNSDSQQGDEFVPPSTIGAPSPVVSGDTVIFFNYRGDRPRQLTRAFMQPQFYGNVPPSPESGERGFPRPNPLDIRFVCMAVYDKTFSEFPNLSAAFEKPLPMADITGGYLADHGRTQFRCAETEKFPHVTFFFNDYREPPFSGEVRAMAQSPKAATYDLEPQMSAAAVCDLVLGRLSADDCENFILVNFANADMVGHTGKLDAAICAVETVDKCVGRIVEATLARGGKLIVTADHGNSEQMWDPQTQSPHTAHTLFAVECILADPTLDRATPLCRNGRLADVLPTALKFMGLDKPETMTGRPLF